MPTAVRPDRVAGPPDHPGTVERAGDCHPGRWSRDHAWRGRSSVPASALGLRRALCPARRAISATRAQQRPGGASGQVARATTHSAWPGQGIRSGGAAWPDQATRPGAGVQPSTGGSDASGGTRPGHAPALSAGTRRDAAWLPPSHATPFAPGRAPWPTAGYPALRLPRHGSGRLAWLPPRGSVVNLPLASARWRHRTRRGIAPAWPGSATARGPHPG